MRMVGTSKPKLVSKPRLGSSAYVKFCENGVQVIFHGSNAQYELACNLLVTKPLRHKTQHLAFATSKLLTRIGIVKLLSPAPDFAEKAAANLWVTGKFTLLRVIHDHTKFI